MLTHSQRLCANIVAAQCLDLGLTQVQVHDAGQNAGLVRAQLQDRIYIFGWDVEHQRMTLEATWSLTQPWELVG